MPFDRLLVSLRPHFLTSLAFFLLVASMIVQESRNARFYTFIPVVLFYFATLAFYSLESSAFFRTTKALAKGAKKTGVATLTRPRVAALNHPRVARPKATRPAVPCASRAHSDALKRCRKANASAMRGAYDLSPVYAIR